MLQKHLYMSDIFSIFVLENQIHTNGDIATYFKHKA